MSLDDPMVLMIIRHGEKPQPDRPELGAGVDERGRPDDKSLAVRGWVRAGAWASLFAAAPPRSDYPRPGAVFAPRPGHPAGASARSAQTAAPIAEALGLTLDTRFGRDDTDALVRELLPRRGVVLLCWEHKRIGEGIVPLIPLADGERAPRAWPSDRFDFVLRFHRPAGSRLFTCSQAFPRLLAGDSATAV